MVNFNREKVKGIILVLLGVFIIIFAEVFLHFYLNELLTYSLLFIASIVFSYGMNLLFVEVRKDQQEQERLRGSAKQKSWFARHPIWTAIIALLITGILIFILDLLINSVDICIGSPCP
jgi:hypothetical protein